MRELLRRIAYALNRHRIEAELREEVEFHRAMKEGELAGRGLTPEEARHQADRAFGNDLVARERSRDVWIAPWIQDITSDLRLALRLSVKDPTFTAASVTILALAIAANTTVFTIANAMYMRGLPVRNPDRIVALDVPQGRLLVSFRDVEDWRAARSFAGIGVYGGASMTIGDTSRAPEVLTGAYISANSFGVLGEQPILGRGFGSQDDRRGAAAVVILGYRVWAGQFGADPSVVGRTIRVNGTPATVIGVMPDGFRFPIIHDVWQPLAAMPRLVTDRRNARTLTAFGRLGAGVSMAQAQAELDAIAERMAREHPETNRNFRPVIEPYTGSGNHAIFIALFGAIAFVLLIACANVANLLLARAARRSREICIRASLGATRWRVVRQLLAESALLAIVAGFIGLLLSAAAVRWFSSLVEGINFPYWYRDRWTMDGRVFAFVTIVCLGTTFLFGLMPAFHLSRADMNRGLKDGGRGGTAGPGARRWTSGLLIAQLAFTVVLLAGAGLMLRSLAHLVEADDVIDTRNLFRASLRLPPAKYADVTRRLALGRTIEDGLDGLQPIASATIASAVPFVGAPQWRIAIDGRFTPAGEQLPAASFVAIGDTYFRTLGLALIAGRSFDERDGRPGQERAIVNQRFSAAFFPGEVPIGRRIRLVNPNASATPSEIAVSIVGVVQTVRHNYFSDIDPAVYVPYRVSPSGAGNILLLVRGRSNEATATAALREHVRAIDPEIIPSFITPIEQDKTQSRWGNVVFGAMIAVFAAIALLIAAVGLYAVTAFGVAQRTQEIGVRMALGAETSAVIWLFIRRAMTPLAIGLVLGLAGALGAGRLIRSMLVQTSPTDWLTLTAISALVVTISLVACFWPASRAARLDPVRALRND